MNSTARKLTMDPLKAKYVKFIEVTDPDTGAEVELEVYKDPESGAMFAIDSTFLEQVHQIIPSPFNPGNDLLCEGGEQSMTRREIEQMAKDGVKAGCGSG